MIFKLLIALEKITLLPKEATQQKKKEKFKMQPEKEKKKEKQENYQERK